MNYVVKLEKKNNIFVVSSRIIAKQLDKRHTDVLRDIDVILEKSDLTFLKNSENADLRSLIIPSNYQVKGQKRNYKEYLLTKDGFTLYMFNIQGYNDFKMAYINEFNRMEQALKNPKLPFEEEKTKMIHTTWRGQPVIELQELAKMIGINGAFIHWHFQKEKCTLKKNELREYKVENHTNRGQASLSILYKETVIAICKHFNVYEKYKDIIENYFRTDNKIEDKTSKVLTEKPFKKEKYVEVVDKIPREELISMRNMVRMLTQEIEKDVKEIKNILGKIEDHKAHINIYTSVLNQF